MLQGKICLKIAGWDSNTPKLKLLHNGLGFAGISKIVALQKSDGLAMGVGQCCPRRRPMMALPRVLVVIAILLLLVCRGNAMSKSRQSQLRYNCALLDTD
jgi:hypothetical protein